MKNKLLNYFLASLSAIAVWHLLLADILTATPVA